MSKKCEICKEPKAQAQLSRSVFGITCDNCYEVKLAEKEAAIIANAEVVEWDGGPLCEIGGGEYYDGPEELEYKFFSSVPANEPVVYPQYMHPCEYEYLGERVSAQNLAESICEKLYADHDPERESMELNEESLVTHIQNWLDNHDNFYFYKEDTSKIVDLNSFWDELEREYEDA